MIIGSCHNQSPEFTVSNLHAIAGTPATVITHWQVTPPHGIPQRCGQSVCTQPPAIIGPSKTPPPRTSFAILHR